MMCKKKVLIKKERKVDVSLVSPVSRAYSRIPPLSLMYIAAYLEKHKIKTNIIDVKSNPYKLFGEREKRTREQ